MAKSPARIDANLKRTGRKATTMKYHHPCARRQRAADAERFGELLNAGHFPAFVDELVATWQEFDAICQRYLNTESNLVAFACEYELFGTPRFHRISLPGGNSAQLFLREANSEEEVRRNPRIVLGLPRSPRRREKGRTV